jgi:thiamine kinase-like enzyme
MFRLSKDNVFSYLIKQNLFLAEDAPPIDVHPLSGKNLNLRLKFADGSDWLVKQEIITQSGGVADCAEEFLGEWAVQSLLQQMPELSALSGLIPPLRCYDRENAILVGTYLSNYVNLSDYYDQDDCAYSATLAGSVGDCLGRLHQLTDNQRHHADWLERTRWLDSVCPRAIAPVSPFTPAMFGRLRDDAITFFRWYQNQPEVDAAIVELAASWQGRCLVHQDLRLENWLLHQDYPGSLGSDPVNGLLGGDRDPVQLIDWEKVGWGDPLTDLANLISMYLLLWLDSIPPKFVGDWSQRLAAATVPLKLLQPSLQMLVAQYRQAFPAVADRPDWEVRLIQWMGRYLIGEVETDIAYHRPMGSRAVLMLQMAKQCLLQPQVLYMSIFGVEPGAL